MLFLTNWIPSQVTFLLLLYIWRAKVSASGVSEEDKIDPTYVIIGVTLGVFLSIGFLALKICMIKRQLIDNDFVDSERRLDRSQRGPRALVTVFSSSVALFSVLTYIQIIWSPPGSAGIREKDSLQEQQSTSNL